MHTLWAIPLSIDLGLMLAAIASMIRTDPRIVPPPIVPYAGRHSAPAVVDQSPAAAHAETPPDLAPTAIDTLRKLTPRWHDLVTPLPVPSVFDGLELPIVPGREVRDGR